jgi:hypothetical protein|tara:strand:- start:1237 stop:2028 length:792 start_codon:yes stop_codon:yes gene_type:complete
MSRATLVDLPPEEENADNVANEVEEIQQEETEQPQEQPTIPEKYQTKSLAEVVQMHQEAEKLLGRQSSEVGELRKVVDDYITSQPQQTAPQPQVEPEDDIDYFTDPQAAVNRAIDNHPKIQEAQAYSNQYKKQTSLATLQSKHPDMQEILKDEKFADWIKASKIRTQLFVEADQRFNSEAADELFSLWKERRTVAQQTAQVEKQARKQQLKAANTGGTQGSAEGTRRKIYRRADIIKLMRTDPERYQAISEEILTAYAEGRVK